MRVPLPAPLRTPPRIWLSILSAALVLTTVLFAQDKSTASNDQIQIRQLERAWNQAEAHHDVGAVTAIVADTLTYIDFDGSIMNKAEYLRDVTKTSYQADHLYDEGLQVVASATAQVVPGFIRETGTGKGQSKF